MPGGWSISDEAMFYLIFPLLLALVTDLRAVVATLAAAVLSRIVFTQLPPLLQASAYAAYPLQTYAAFLFATQLPAFLCGFLAFFAIAALQVRPEHPFNCKPVATAALLASGLLLIGAAASDNKTLTNYLLADALFVPLVVAAYASRSRLIVNRRGAHVGIVSYSVYIVHFARSRPLSRCCCRRCAASRLPPSSQSSGFLSSSPRSPSPRSPTAGSRCPPSGWARSWPSARYPRKKTALIDVLINYY